MKNPKQIPRDLLDQLEMAKEKAQAEARARLQRELDLNLFVVSLAEASSCHIDKYGVDGTYTARFNAVAHNTCYLLDALNESNNDEREGVNDEQR